MVGELGYGPAKVRSRRRSIGWTRDDLAGCSEDQLKLLYAFVPLDRHVLTTQELQRFTGVHGKKISGPTEGLAGRSKKAKDWLLRRRPAGDWGFNPAYRKDILWTVKQFGLHD